MKKKTFDFIIRLTQAAIEIMVVIVATKNQKEDDHDGTGTTKEK